MRYPEPFLDNLRALLGGEFPSFERALAEAPVRGARLNPGKPGAAFGPDAVPWEPDGRYVDAGYRPGADPLHFAGALYMQEPSAMAPARALNVKPGERVLDLCAAPGGKSGQLAAALREQGALVCNEPERGRAKALSGNLERLGATNALVVSALPKALAQRWPEAFDAILVDAPCSGEGMFRRDPEAVDQWQPGSPAGCAARQAEILDCAAAMLRPGGRLAYSTCTFNALENEGVVQGFLDGHPAFEAAEFALPGAGASEHGMLRLWPHRVRGEGQFVALMAKAAGNRRSPLPPERGESIGGDPRSPAGVALAQLETAVPGSWTARIRGWDLVLQRDTLCAAPPGLPDAKGLPVLRRGIHLCQLGNGYVKPDHALAMALTPAETAQSIELDEEHTARFLRGHEIPCPERLSGWALVTHRALPLGWGKAVQGTLKNHLPKGLRLH